MDTELFIEQRGNRFAVISEHFNQGQLNAVEVANFPKVEQAQKWLDRYVAWRQNLRNT